MRRKKRISFIPSAKKLADERAKNLVHGAITAGLETGQAAQHGCPFLAHGTQEHVLLLARNLAFNRVIRNAVVKTELYPAPILA